jgi:hypothetical protein
VGPHLVEVTGPGRGHPERLGQRLRGGELDEDRCAREQHLDITALTNQHMPALAQFADEQDRRLP